MSDFEKKCNEYRENKRMIEELENINEAIKSDIIAMMDGKDEKIEGAAKATYKPVTSSRLDSKAIQEKHPKIYEKFLKTTSYHRFVVV